MWQSLEEASGEAVRDIVSPWIDTAGYPLISAELIQNGRILRLTQKRFLSYEEEEEEESLVNGDQKWCIPVSCWLSVGGGANVEKNMVLMKDRQVLVQLPDTFDISKPGNWIKLNVNFDGFYRVKYSVVHVCPGGHLAGMPEESMGVFPGARAGI